MVSFEPRSDRGNWTIFRWWWQHIRHGRGGNLYHTDRGRFVGGGGQWRNMIRLLNQTTIFGKHFGPGTGCHTNTNEYHRPMISDLPYSYCTPAVSCPVILSAVLSLSSSLLRSHRHRPPRGNGVRCKYRYIRFPWWDEYRFTTDPINDDHPVGEGWPILLFPPLVACCCRWWCWLGETLVRCIIRHGGFNG